MLGRGQTGETKCFAQRHIVFSAEPVENLSHIRGSAGVKQSRGLVDTLLDRPVSQEGCRVVPFCTFPCLHLRPIGLRSGGKVLHFEATDMALYPCLTMSFLPGTVSLQMPAPLSIKWTRR